MGSVTKSVQWIMSSMSITSIIIPFSLVAACTLLLVNLWSTSSVNKSIAEEVGRAESEVDMAQYQKEFCLLEVKQKEKERKVKIEEEQNVKNQLRKALDTKKNLILKKNIFKTQVEQTRAEKENNKGTARQLEENLAKIQGDVEKQEA